MSYATADIGNNLKRGGVELDMDAVRRDENAGGPAVETHRARSGAINNYRGGRLSRRRPARSEKNRRKANFWPKTKSPGLRLDVKLADGPGPNAIEVLTGHRRDREQ
jgi:hypothetical protein